MDRAQLRRRAHVRLTLIADDLVSHAEFLQQPQHALGAGIVEMMDGQHGEFPQGIGDDWMCRPRSSGRRGWRLDLDPHAATERAAPAQGILPGRYLHRYLPGYKLGNWKFRVLSDDLHSSAGLHRLFGS